MQEKLEKSFFTMPLRIKQLKFQTYAFLLVSIQIWTDLAKELNFKLGPSLETKTFCTKRENEITFFSFKI